MLNRFKYENTERTSNNKAITDKNKDSLNLTHYYEDKEDIIRTAINKKFKIKFRYAKENGDVSERVVHPLLLFKYEKIYVKGVVYVFCFCELRSEYRIFKLDSISNIVVLDEIFIVRPIDLSILLQNVNKGSKDGFRLSYMICLSYVPEIKLPYYSTGTTNRCESCFYRFDCSDKYVNRTDCNNFKPGPTRRPEHWPKEMLIRYVNSKKRRQW